MPTVTEYAVRVKGTQMYLPRSQRRDGRGGSHLEPVDFSLPPGARLDRSKQRYEGELQIRSYATRQAAANLLRVWCEGKFVGQDWDEDCGWLYAAPKKGSARDPKLLEVVELTIFLPD